MKKAAVLIATLFLLSLPLSAQEYLAEWQGPSPMKRVLWFRALM